MGPKKLVDVMKTVSTGHNRLFIREISRRASSEKMVNVLKDDGVCEAFKSAIIQVATSGPMV